MKKEAVHTIEKHIKKVEMLIEVCKENNELLLADELSLMLDEMRTMISSCGSSKNEVPCVNKHNVTRFLIVLKMIHEVFTHFFNGSSE